MDYPLYDVPWLVRDPNEYRMSAKRHQIEKRNQAVVDDYFLNTITWFFHEAEKRRKYDFLQKFSLLKEH